MKGLIWGLLILAIYPYLLYPLILRFLRIFFRKKDLPQNVPESDLPLVTLLITAYNEEKLLEKKILNSLELDYPKLEIVIVSDGSLDNTNSILGKYPNLKTVILEARQGKPSAIQAGLQISKGDIICFSDVSALYGKESLRELIRPLFNPDVGSSGGILSLTDENHALLGEITYSDYETTLRDLESALWGTIVLPGTFYAVWAKDLVLPPPGFIADDFFITCSLLEKNLKLVQVNEAIAFEKSSTDTKGEFLRKSRIIAGGIQTMMHFRKLLFTKWGFFLLSHKALRWSAGILALFHYLLLGMCGYCPFLFAFETLILSLSAAGLILELLNKKNPYPLKLLGHFLLVNIAVIWGFFGLLSGRQTVKWER